MYVCFTREPKPPPGCVMLIMLRFRDWHRFDSIKRVRWNGSANHARGRRARVRGWETV